MFVFVTTQLLAWQQVGWQDSYSLRIEEKIRKNEVYTIKKEKVSQGDLIRCCQDDAIVQYTRTIFLLLLCQPAPLLVNAHR